jgi:hypothetical protein
MIDVLINRFGILSLITFLLSISSGLEMMPTNSCVLILHALCLEGRVLKKLDPSIEIGSVLSFKRKYEENS